MIILPGVPRDRWPTRAGGPLEGYNQTKKGVIAIIPMSTGLRAPAISPPLFPYEPQPPPAPPRLRDSSVVVPINNGLACQQRIRCRHVRANLHEISWPSGAKPSSTIYNTFAEGRVRVPREELTKLTGMERQVSNGKSLSSEARTAFLGTRQVFSANLKWRPGQKPDKGRAVTKLFAHSAISNACSRQIDVVTWLVISVTAADYTVTARIGGESREDQNWPTREPIFFRLSISQTKGNK
ncbi:hypothetical protein BIW11_08719 [Tropilaelaps mercedesae]|uniref:Uncharacterized protein n=1 Tax=Tropilaelaps mercedesae TaxID=418985 RepID=A0A1V9XNA7_9ACAR|nr:hypothetical protein BIW11_08719 [Tropilaelaps mercedesae]